MISKIQIQIHKEEKQIINNNNKTCKGEQKYNA